MGKTSVTADPAAEPAGNRHSRTARHRRDGEHRAGDPGRPDPAGPAAADRSARHRQVVSAEPPRRRARAASTGTTTPACSTSTTSSATRSPMAPARLDYIQTPAAIWGAQSVFIDEISRCRPEVQNKLFSIVHERRVQGLELRDLVYRWSAMNPPAADDGDSPYAGSEPLDRALADRFAFVLDIPDWQRLGPGCAGASDPHGGHARSTPKPAAAWRPAHRDRPAHGGAHPGFAFARSWRATCDPGLRPAAAVRHRAQPAPGRHAAAEHRGRACRAAPGCSGRGPVALRIPRPPPLAAAARHRPSGQRDAVSCRPQGGLEIGRRGPRTARYTS